MSGMGKILEIYDYIRPVLDIGVLAFILYKMYGKNAKFANHQIRFYDFSRLCTRSFFEFIDLIMDFEFICARRSHRLCDCVPAGTAQNRF